jgi:internalin A
MGGRRYVFEDSPEGRWLVVTGPWSDEAAGALARGEADGLVLNYARGFCEPSLDFLDGGWPVRRLDVLDRSIADLEPIGRLAALEEVSVQAAPAAALDFKMLPRLQSAAGPWALIGDGLSGLSALESVVTWAFDELDLHAFRDHAGLRSLTIKDAPYLESLSGVGGLPELATLTVVLAPRLREIEDVAELSASLQELKLEKCPQVDAIDDIETAVGMRFLGVSECGDIASLAPVGSLTELEAFYAWGSTRIVDGDLSPLTRLPRLKEVRMRNRRGYRPTVADLVASLPA